MIDIKVPTVGESINEVTLIKWLKQTGDYGERDEMNAKPQGIEKYQPVKMPAISGSNTRI